MEKNSEESIERVLSCIEENLFRKPDLNMAAHAAHYSRYHLHRMFTRMTGMPLYSYMERRRLTEAAKLLVYSQKPFHDHDPDFHHHPPSGKNRTLYPGTHFRLDGFHVCRFPSPGNGHIRSSVRPCFPERPDVSLRRSLRCTVCSRSKVDEIKNGIL